MEIRQTNQANNSKQVSLSQEARQKKIDDIAQNFEAIFIKMMFSKMTETLDQSFFGSGTGNHMYQGLFEEKLTEYVSNGKGLGLQDKLKDYLNNQLNVASLSSFESEQKKIKNADYIQHELMFDTSILKRALDHQSKVQPKTTPENFSAIIEQAGNEFGVPKELITAVIRAESGGDINAVSKKGAKGLMQLMDSTAQELNVERVFNPKENIYGGTKYLGKLIKQYGGDIEKALAAYNAGASNVDKYNGIPPFKETQNYVKKIMSEYSEVTHGQSDK